MTALMLDSSGKKVGNKTKEVGKDGCQTLEDKGNKNSSNSTMLSAKSMHVEGAVPTEEDILF